MTPTRNAIANDWIGASRVAALNLSSKPGRGATAQRLLCILVDRNGDRLNLCRSGHTDTIG
jgi:hypothetical protein